MVGTTFGTIAKGQLMSTDDFLNILANIPQEKKFAFSVLYLTGSILVRIAWCVFVWNLSDLISTYLPT